MGDLVVSRFGSVEAIQKYANALAGVSVLVGSDNDRDILGVNADDGYWVFSQDKIELVEGKDILAVNPVSFRHGYIAFGKNEIAYDMDGNLAEVLVPITQPLPHTEDLPELEEIKGKRGEKARAPSWQLQLAVDMVVIEGPNKGAELVYKPTSRGGLKMMRRLSDEISRVLAGGDDACVPVIELYVDSYNNRTYGKRVYTPEFAIIEWLGLNEAEFEAPKETRKGKDDVPAKHPKKGERTAKGDKVDNRRSARDRDEAEEEVEDAPRGRGRRGRDEDSDPAPREKEREARGNRRSTRELDDAEGDAPPARSRRGRDEEPEEDAPRTRSRRGREEDADSDAPPARRRAAASRDEEPEEDAPRTRGRRGREDEAEDDAPVRGRRAAAGGRRR